MPGYTTEFNSDSHYRGKRRRLLKVTRPNNCWKRTEYWTQTVVPVPVWSRQITAPRYFAKASLTVIFKTSRCSKIASRANGSNDPKTFRLRLTSHKDTELPWNVSIFQILLWTVPEKRLHAWCRYRRRSSNIIYACDSAQRSRVPEAFDDLITIAHCVATDV